MKIKQAKSKKEMKTEGTHEKELSKKEQSKITKMATTLQKNKVSNKGF